MNTFKLNNSFLPPNSNSIRYLIITFDKNFAWKSTHEIKQNDITNAYIFLPDIKTGILSKK